MPLAKEGWINRGREIDRDMSDGWMDGRIDRHRQTDRDRQEGR